EPGRQIGLVRIGSAPDNDMAVGANGHTELPASGDVREPRPWGDVRQVDRAPANDLLRNDGTAGKGHEEQDRPDEPYQTKSSSMHKLLREPFWITLHCISEKWLIVQSQ